MNDGKIAWKNTLIVTVVLLASSALVACGRGGGAAESRQRHVTPARLAALAALAQENQDIVAGPAGFVDSAHCDSLQHSGLMAAAGAAIDMRAAEIEPGRWLRRPASLPECWASGESRSTISRDQLLGVLWWAWTVKDAQAVRDLWNYGEPRTWVMGEGRFRGADTVLSYNDIVLLAHLCARMDAGCGANYRKWALFSPILSGTPRGFERHLDILRIMLFWEVDGHPPFRGVERLRQHALEQLWNPLPVAALASQGLADGVQVDSRLEALGYPMDRLPDSRDWCSHWIVETEDGSKPCPDEGHLHSAGELLFMARLFSGRP